MERIRKQFASASSILEPPHLISMQRKSYEQFLQINCDPDEREDIGLQAILKEIFPIHDFNGVCSLEFVNHKGEFVDTLYEKGTTSPGCVILPKTTAEVQKIIKLCFNFL